QGEPGGIDRRQNSLGVAESGGTGPTLVVHPVDNGPRMRLDWALLANAAEAPPNGLVYILGAGFDTLIRDQYPTPLGGVIVLRLQTTRLETERPHKVEVHGSDEDGKPVLQQPIVLNLPARQVPAEYPPGWDLSANIVINI